MLLGLALKTNLQPLLLLLTLTLQVNSVSQGTYKPASAAKTINIAVPTKTSQITNDSGFITSASIPTALKNPYAVEIKANGVSLGTYDGSKAATFNLSAASYLVSTHTEDESLKNDLETMSTCTLDWIMG